MQLQWRKWYAARHGLTDDEVIGVIPNIVIPTHYQACWEKAFRYFDIKPKFLHPEFRKFRINPEDIRDLVDEKTIVVVGILGNHYNGTYDPIWKMDQILTEINEQKGFQVGLHVDGASGGLSWWSAGMILDGEITHCLLVMRCSVDAEKLL